MSNDSGTRITEARNALKQGDFVTARAFFKDLADTGSKQALLGLAAIYERGGEGVPQDMAAARYWYERAFNDASLIVAGLALGKMSYLGLGGDVDYEKAFACYSKLEKANNPIALFRLGAMYETGKGVPRDIEQARTLYRRSAKLRNIYARKQWGVLEVKNGNVLLGALLWASALIHGPLLVMMKPYDPRLKCF